MSFAYSVAIRLTVANLASQGVRLLAKDLLAAHGNAMALGDKLKALKLMAVGYGVDRAGQGILGFMGKAIDASKDYTRQISLMNAAGLTHQEIAGSVAAAWQTSKDVITSSAAENLATIRELRSAFGAGEGMNHAFAVLPMVQRAQAIMQSYGKADPNLGFDMVKAIEFGTKGAISISNMTRQAEMMTKALVAFQGTLTVADFHATLKAAKSAAPYLTDDFKYTILPTLMQEMKSGHGGAQAAGTALATLLGTIKGHAIITRMIPAWVAGGLIRPGGIVVDPHHKGMSRVGPNGIVDEDLFTKNPLAWAVKDLIPARDRLMKKLHVDDLGAYYALTGNRNSAFMMQTLVNKGAQIARDQQLIKNVGSSYSSYQKLLASNPDLAQQAMHNQWQNILAIIGYQILPAMIPLMQSFAQALQPIGQWMQQNQGATKAIAWGLLGLGSALTLVGKAMMAAGVIKFLGLGPFVMETLAPIALIVGGVAVGIGLFAFSIINNWKEIKSAGIQIWSSIKTMFTDLFHGDIMGAFNSFCHVYDLAFQTFLNTQIAMLNAILPKAWQISKLHFADVVPPPKPVQVTVHNKTYIGNKQVGDHVAQHLVKGMSRPNAGRSVFDATRSPLRPATAR